MGTYPRSHGSVTITSPSIDVFTEILTTVDRFREIETKSDSISQNYLYIFDESKNPEQICERADSVSVTCDFNRTGRRDFKEMIKTLIYRLQKINPALKEYSFSLSFAYFEDEWPYFEGYLEATIETSYSVQSGEVTHNSIKEIYHEEDVKWFLDFYGPIKDYANDEDFLEAYTLLKVSVVSIYLSKKEKSMIYDTVDKIYSKIAEYARRPEGGVHRLLLIHAPKERFQKIADLAPEGDEELKRILAENGIHLRD